MSKVKEQTKFIIPDQTDEVLKARAAVQQIRDRIAELRQEEQSMQAATPKVDVKAVLSGGKSAVDDQLTAIGDHAHRKAQLGVVIAALQDSLRAAEADLQLAQQRAIRTRKHQADVQITEALQSVVGDVVKCWHSLHAITNFIGDCSGDNIPMSHIGDIHLGQDIPMFLAQMRQLQQQFKIDLSKLDLPAQPSMAPGRVA